jgi:hypothetical protein
MTKKLIMILGLVLSSMLMKAQAFFVPFPKAGDKYWRKQVPVAMRNDYIRLGNLYQKKKKVENMGRFITTMYINDLTFVNFSDAQAQNVPNINILFPYGAYLQNEQMMQLAAYVAKKYLYMQNPSELYRK